MIKSLLKKAGAITLATSISFSSFAIEIAQGAKVVLEPNKRAILSARVDGTLKNFPITEGEIFKKNDLLFQIDDRYFRQNFVKSEALQKEAESAVRFNTKNYEQGEKLYKNNNLGLLELEQRLFEKTRAEIAVKQTAADLEIARNNLADCSVYAPFDGRVVRRIAQEHEELPSSQYGRQVIQIIDDRVLKAVMYLPSNVFNDIKFDMTLRITIDETGKVYKAKVIEKAAEMDPLSQTFAVRALLDNSSQELRAGMVGSLCK